MVPARFAQALLPLVFALLIDDFGTRALWLSAGLGVLAYAAMTFLQRRTHGLARRRRAPPKPCQRGSAASSIACCSKLRPRNTRSAA